MAGGMIPLHLITNANLTYFRRDLGDLKPLIASLRKGQDAPVVLDGNYQILDGARRVEALKALGAQEVWAISTGSWLTVREELIRAEQRHQEPGAIFLPMSPKHIIGLLPVLFDMQRAYLTSLQVARPRRMTVRRTKAQSEAEGVIGTVSRLAGMRTSAVKRLSMAGNRIREYHAQGRHDRAAMVEAWLDQIEAGELGVSRLDTMLRDLSQGPESVQARLEKKAAQLPPVQAAFEVTPPVAVKPLPVRQEARRMNDALTLVEGALAALDPYGFNAEHDPADIERWNKQLKTLTTFAARMRVRFREISEEKANNGNQ